MILVVGGTGRLGAALVGRRARGDEPVRVLTRDPRRAEHLGADVDVVIGDVRDPVSLGHAFDGVRLVVAAAHGFVGTGGVSPANVDRDGNRNVVRAAEAAGAHIVLLSIVGASADHPLELFRMKAAAEAFASAASAPTTTVRPTAFTELWIELLRTTARRSGRPLVFGRGANPINFVSVNDVAHLVDLVIDDDEARGLTLEIGGPEDLSFNDLVAVLADHDGSIGRPRHVPPPMLRTVAATVGRLKPELRRQCLTAIAMDRDDFAFDGGSARTRYPEIACTKVTDLL